jgi:hypothetical protein
MGCACIQQETSKYKKDTTKKSETNRRHQNSLQSQHGNVNQVNDGQANHRQVNNVQNRPLENSQPRSGLHANRNNQSSRGINIQTFQVNSLPIQGLPLGEIYLQSKNNPNFNYPEIGNKDITLEGIYSGHGLKRMKGYICNHSKEELVRKRQEFWGNLKPYIGTRTEGNSEVWQSLEKLCNSNEFSDDELLYSVLEAMEVKPYHDCLNVCFDNHGAVYEIPNYCINEPHEYRLESIKAEHKPVSNDIKVCLRKVIDEVVIDCKDTWKVGELKNSVKTIGDVTIHNPENVRLFYAGKELQNDEELWFYHIDNGSIVQLLYKEGDI